MDIHKPKPIHGWRDFLKEFATIVLGVSVALAAEQGVEWFHWRTQVREARSIIATEMAQNVANSIRRVRTEQCLERRLDTLAEILDGASASGRLPPMGDIGYAPRRSWAKDAWDSLVASQTATHFPRQELALLARTYNQVQRMNEWGPVEVMAWSNLTAMTGPGRRLDAVSEENLRNALNTARTLNRAVAIVSLGIIRNVDSLHLPLSADDLNVIASARQRDLLRSDKVTAANPIPATDSVCQPMGASAPPHYGQALYGFPPGVMDEAIKTLPDFGAH